MTRFRRIEEHDRYFFITTNLSRDQRILNEVERDIVLDGVGNQHNAAAFWLFAYVVMPNHSHLLVRPRDHDLLSAMHDLKIHAGKKILDGRESRGPLWQQRYFDNIIRNVAMFWKKVEYIHNNPVEARLVSHPGEWRWSSYAAYFKSSHAPPIPIDPIDLPADGDALLWPAPWRR